jgi:hypothetical protein
MSREYGALRLDSVTMRRTSDYLGISGWLLVLDDVPQIICDALQKVQDKAKEPWLAPRHGWMVKYPHIYVAVSETDGVTPSNLWDIYDTARAQAKQAVFALARIIDVMNATMGSAAESAKALAAVAEAMAERGVPIFSGYGEMISRLKP